ncbi:hypothetical protein [Bacillus sp. ISL-46]|uniref:hypothetical protein n=1 Tax=Bacillus sp. ISL-46 TaxID=2819129 RepID=UPI001BEB4642|nr:hypothetical protein [Bacillus sp. ISL-46]MBT2722294.1 hypothetical protein [Bacillus sp. ISL-46]
MRSVDVIYCMTDSMAKAMFDYWLDKGFTVMQSTVEIETGTHGKHVVKRLDILI